MNIKNMLLAACGSLVLASTGCLGDSLEVPGGGAGAQPDAGATEPDPDPDPTPTPDAGVTDPGGELGEAQALFNSTVAPAVMETCGAGGGCHVAQAPAFISAADTYVTIKTYRDQLFVGYEPGTAKLLAKAETGHYGATFTATEIAAIEAWLTQEKVEAAGGGGEQPSPMAIWSGCMDLNDWNDEQVASGWANKNAGGAGRCEACHNLGADRFMASDDSQRVFDSITTDSSLMPSYFTLDAAGTAVIINRARFELVGGQQAPHQAHGPFDVDGGAMERLQRFYDKTVARKINGLCQPPRLVK